jgi:hypothetical protein
MSTQFVVEDKFHLLATHFDRLISRTNTYFGGKLRTNCTTSRYSSSKKSLFVLQIKSGGCLYDMRTADHLALYISIDNPFSRHFEV